MKKKLFDYAFAAFAALALSMGFASCSDNNDGPEDPTQTAEFKTTFILSMRTENFLGTTLPNMRLM